MDTKLGNHIGKGLNVNHTQFLLKVVTSWSPSGVLGALVKNVYSQTYVNNTLMTLERCTDLSDQIKVISTTSPSL